MLLNVFKHLVVWARPECCDFDDIELDYFAPELERSCTTPSERTDPRSVPLAPGKDSQHEHLVLVL